MIRQIRAVAALAIAATLALGATSATAATRLFSGNKVNVNAPPQPDAGCSPLLRLAFGPGGTTGASNFGDFTYTQTHCTTGGPGAYAGGVFSYLFAAGDMLSGTYSGLLVASGTPGLNNNTLNLVVTGGTGRFLGGTGTITGIGTVDFRGGQPRAALALDGVLALPAVPEPAVWTSMIAGFGAVGAAVRRRRAAGGLHAA